MTLPRHAASAGRAREGLRGLTGVPPEQRGDVELLVTELIGNAVRHARGEQIVVTAEVVEHEVRVAVSDDEHAAPVPRLAPPSATSGRGLGLVEVLASRWGVEQHPEDGKTVWFDVSW